MGELIAAGKGLEQALAETRMVAEGVETTRAVCRIGAEHGVELPISEQAYQVLYEGKQPVDAVRDLESRPQGPESKF